jgi:predicted DNA binding CopG/RHH family protein
MEEKRMKIKLDAYEQSIEDNAEKFIPLNETEKAEIESIIRSANKTKNINIRISAYDMEKVRERSVSEGIPYQTLISSVIHKYITGKLVDEQTILKSLELLRK